MHRDRLAVTKLDPDATLTADAPRTRRQVPILAAVPPADCGKLDRFHRLRTSVEPRSVKTFRR
jgi:hypothetical protein